MRFVIDVKGQEKLKKRPDMKDCNLQYERLQVILDQI